MLLASVSRSNYKFWEVFAQTQLAGVMTFLFLFLLAFHLILLGKLDMCGRDDLQRTHPPFA